MKKRNLYWLFLLVFMTACQGKQSVKEGEIADDQLSAYIDINSQTDQPTENEIPYEDIAEYVQAAVDHYGLGNGKLLPYEATLITSPDGEHEGWAVTLLYESGNQYVITLNAVDGNLKSWLMWAAGTFTQSDLSPTSQKIEETELTEEEACQEAKKYFLSVEKDSAEIIDISTESESSSVNNMGTVKKVWITTSDDKKYEIAILNKDKTVVNFIVQE